MKYPLDPTTYVENVRHILEHEKTQVLIIQKMGSLLESAMDFIDSDNIEWYKESETLLKDLHAMKMYHESRRWNEDNYQRQQHMDDGPDLSLSVLEDTYTPSETHGEMTEEDLSKHFKEKRKDKKKKEEPKTLKSMTNEEIVEWEQAQENSNDIYKVKARVANLARGNGLSLTPQGDQLVNTYVHVLKSFYAFAEKLEDKNVKVQLTALIRSVENMPGTLIAAAGAGVVVKKDK